LAVLISCRVISPRWSACPSACRTKKPLNCVGLNEVENRSKRTGVLETLGRLHVLIRQVLERLGVPKAAIRLLDSLASNTENEFELLREAVMPAE